LLLCVALVLASGVQPQAVSCVNPATQIDMTQCAWADFEAADGELNWIYGAVIAAARNGGFEDEIRAAQRAWIGFRDAACEAEAAPYDGGSIQPMIEARCLERVTLARIEDLQYFLDF
jgi:uncharacterized protein YecT (DUF1311 family)